MDLPALGKYGSCWVVSVRIEVDQFRLFLHGLQGLPQAMFVKNNNNVFLASYQYLEVSHRVFFTTSMSNCISCHQQYRLLVILPGA